MHEPIRNGLEDFLGGTAGRQRESVIDDHLRHCPECRGAVAAMRQHQAMLRQLRAPGELSPAPGFYARVLARIEAQRTNSISIWSIFLEPLFARRLAYASLALFVLLGTALWQGGAQEALDEGNPIAVIAGDLPDADGADPGHDRAVVLTHLVSTDGGGQEFSALPVSND